MHRRTLHIKLSRCESYIVSMNRKTAIFFGVGCSSLIVISVIVGIAVVSFVPKVFEWGGQQFSLEQERRQLADNWQPPEKNASPETLFPARVGNYELASHDEDAAIPEFRFDLNGRHAVYNSSASRIDVFVYQASELEKEALFQRVDDAYEEQAGGFKRKTNMGYRLYYSSSRHHQNHFWWVKGWLLVFRTHDSDDRGPFVKDYLQTTSAQRKSDTP